MTVKSLGPRARLPTQPPGALKYETTALTAKAGKVRFEFANDAPVGRDFVIEQDGEKVAGTDVITESSTTLDTELEAGEYAFFARSPAIARRAWRAS